MVALRFAALEIDNMCRHLVWHFASFHANFIFCENFMFVMQGSDTCNLWVICFSDLASSKHLFVNTSGPFFRAANAPWQQRSKTSLWKFIALSSVPRVFLFLPSVIRCSRVCVHNLPRQRRRVWNKLASYLVAEYLYFFMTSLSFFLLQKFLDDWPKPIQFCFALVQSNHIVWRWHYFALTCHLPPIWTQLFSTSFSAWTMAFEPFSASNSGRFRRPEPQTFVAQPALLLGVGWSVPFCN